MANLVEVKVPDLGGYKGVDVLEVLVKPGATVAIDDPLVTLSSDKASMDVPSTVAGVVKEIRVKAGGKVDEGDVVVVVESAQGAEGASTSLKPPLPVGEGEESKTFPPPTSPAATCSSPPAPVATPPPRAPPPPCRRSCA